MLGKREAADGVDRWFEIATDYHVNEQSVFTLRRALRNAGFERPQVWVDPDVLRSGQYHLTSSLDGPMMRLAARVAGLRPLRLFLGNDVIGIAHRQ
jgi:hypothetical protein